MGAVPDASRFRSKVFRAGPSTAAEARWFVAEALDHFDSEVDRETATLLTSEVASNAARHGKEPIDVTVSVEGRDVRVSVFDRGAGFDPEQLTLDHEREGGWGLRIVQDLSSAWGVDRGENGTEVWFRL